MAGVLGHVDVIEVLVGLGDSQPTDKAQDEQRQSGGEGQPDGTAVGSRPLNNTERQGERHQDEANTGGKRQNQNGRVGFIADFSEDFPHVCIALR